MDNDKYQNWVTSDKSLISSLNPSGEKFWSEQIRCFSTLAREDIEKRYSMSVGSWYRRVSYDPPAPTSGSIKTVRIPFRRAEPYKQEGYAEASIGVRYRLLICANELQIAYGLDRGSLETSDTYFTREKGVLKSGPAPKGIPPTTIELNGVVSIGGSDYVVARFKDAIAGESLGFDCFSGQTKELGPTSKLVPANIRGNPAATRTWLDSLVLHQAFNSLPTVLRSIGAATESTGPADAKADTGQSSTEQVQSEQVEKVAAEERAKLAQLNAENAAKAKAASDAIVASKAKYAADLAAYQAALAETQAAKARYDDQMRQHESEVVEYQRQRAAYEAKIKGSKKPE